MQEDLMEQSLPSGEHFTSIAHTTIDNSDFVFAGTNGGNLYQVRQSSVFDLNSNPNVKLKANHSRLSGHNRLWYTLGLEVQFGSLVPRPCPAFCRLQYPLFRTASDGKLGRTWERG